MKAKRLIQALSIVTLILPALASAEANTSSVGASSVGSGSGAKTWSLRPEIGISEMSYEDDLRLPFSSNVKGSTKTSQMAVKAKVSYLQELPESDWRLGASFAMDVLSSAYNLQPAFRTIAADVGFQNDLFFIDPSFSLGVVAGAYYRHMSASNDEFGYSNLIGPQLYPTATKVLGGGSRVSGYLKFSPLNHLFSIVDHEIGAGVAYTFPASRTGSDLRVSMDLSRRHLIVDRGQIDNGAFETEMTDRAATLAVSYGL